MWPSTRPEPGHDRLRLLCDSIPRRSSNVMPGTAGRPARVQTSCPYSLVSWVEEESSNGKESVYECLSQRRQSRGEHRSRQGDQRDQAGSQEAADQRNECLGLCLDPEI